MAERLETNEARRRELLADVAHELRTPLQAIRGTVEGMLDGLYPADAERTCARCSNETDLMARLLDDLRTLSMAEAGVLHAAPGGRWTRARCADDACDRVRARPPSEAACALDVVATTGGSRDDRGRPGAGRRGAGEPAHERDPAHTP